MDVLASTPTLSVSPATGDEDTAIALNIDGALADLDGSESLSVLIGQVPSGAQLSAGTDNGDGTWTLSAAQLNGLSFTPPQDYNGQINLTVTAEAVEAFTGNSAYVQSTLTVTVDPVNDAPVVEYGKTLAQHDTIGAVNLNIAAPTDADGDALTVTVDQTPSNGGLTLSDGVTPVVTGQELTIAQLTSLKFTPQAQSVQVTSEFLYTVTDGNGGSVQSGVHLTSYDDGSVGETLIGEMGDDTLLGWTGNDTISGGEGDDLLQGGAGNDILTGGAGNDTFVFQQGDGSDEVNDFGVGDHLVLEGYSLADLQFIHEHLPSGEENTLAADNGAGQFDVVLHGQDNLNYVLTDMGDYVDVAAVAADETLVIHGGDIETIVGLDHQEVLLFEGLSSEDLTITQDGNDLHIVGGVGQNHVDVTIDDRANSSYSISDSEDGVMVTVDVGGGGA